MRRPKVYVTRLLPDEALVKLREYCEVTMNPGYEILSQPELLKAVAGQDAVLVSHTTINAQVCEAIAPRCKILASFGVGYNNIDMAAATKQGIYVSNNPDAVTGATADLAWTLLLAAARRIVECDRFVRAGRKEWGPTNLLGFHVSEKTLGIIGAGRIGTAVGRRASGFDMNILYTDVQPSPAFEAATGGKFVDKETLLKEADFISIHVPLLASTHHYIGANELKLMKKTAVLVNASRGEVIDEKALVEALRNRTIAAAGLDVFEKEPEITEGLAELANVVLSPHIGTSTLHTRIKQGEGCVHNIIAALEGKIPPNCLNPEAKANRLPES